MNQPIWAAIVKKPEMEDDEFLPKNADGTPMFSPIIDIPQTSFFEVIDSPNCVITAFKRSERSPEKYILRVAEVRGEQTMM